MKRFRVTCDETNNSKEDLDAGRIHVRVDIGDALSPQAFERALKTLEESNIPPIVCRKCGAKFYVAFPPNCKAIIEDVVPLCDTCFGG